MKKGYIKRQWVVYSGVSILLGMALTTSVYADQTLRNATLRQVVNQLQSLKPLIAKAAQEQDTSGGTQIHFTHWTDANGQAHPGLLDDIATIQQGILNAMQTPTTPRTPTPIRGDFIGGSA